MQQYSRLDNYGHNAGLSSKSLPRQKHTRTEDNNYPRWIMRQLRAHSLLSKQIDDRIRGALHRLQWLSENWLNATEVRQHWYEQGYASKCVAVSACLTVLLVFIQAYRCSGISRVSLTVTLPAKSFRRLTLFCQVDYTPLMESVSQLHDNFLSHPLSVYLENCEKGLHYIPKLGIFSRILKLKPKLPQTCF